MSSMGNENNKAEMEDEVMVDTTQTESTREFVQMQDGTLVSKEEAKEWDKE